VLVQSTNETFLRATADENWRLVARNKLHLGNGDINLVEEVRKLAEILQNHTHGGIDPGGGTTAPPTQAGAIGAVKETVDVINEG